MKFTDESPFVGSKYYHPEIAVRPNGIAGNPIPYTLSRDNVITGLLLLCFVIATVSVAFSRNFILRNLRSLFYVPRRDNEVVETGNEVRFQIFLCLQTSLIYAIVFYLYTTFHIGSQPMTIPQVLPIATFAITIMAYLALKWTVHQLVDHTFFSKRSISHWNRLRLFLTASEGILVFPLLLVQIYFGLPLIVTMIYALFVVVLVKILTFYKAQNIFFKASSGFVQNILYFCALELMPLGALWGVLNIVQHYLKVNF